MQPGSDYFELADYLGVLRRRWLTVLVITLAGLALAGAYYYVAPRTYAATVLVQVNALQTNANALGGRTSGPVNMDNEGQIAQSATVAAIARAQLKSPLSVTGLLANIKVAVPPNTTFLQITCSAGTADLAQRCANAFGRAYLYNRRTTALGLINSTIKALDDQASALETSIQQLKVKVSRHGLAAGSAARGVAELQLSAKLARLGTIQSKINSATPLEANLSVKNTAVGQVVTPAVKPFAPVSPKKKLLLPSGAAAGLLIGLVFAFFWDWRRPRVHTARDVQRRVDLPTVFDLTKLKDGARTVFAVPRSAVGQVFTELAQYLGSTLGDGHHVVLVTATAAQADDGTVAANLASALARTRGEAVLICADPHGTPMPRLLGIPDGRGFAELVGGTALLADVARRTADVPLLRVITPGQGAAGTAYDMRHDKVQRIMRELRREVRYVIIDVPPPSLDADIFSLAEFADAAIVTVQAGTTRPSEITGCVQRLERMRTAVLAAVLLPRARRSPADRSRRSEIIDSPEVYTAPRSHQDLSAQPSRQLLRDEAGGLRRDEAGGSSQPVIRPVTRPASNGGSRHAAPGRHFEQADADAPGFASAWTPRSVSETWPLPQTRPTGDFQEEPERGFQGVAPQDSTEEAGVSDPLIGN